MADGSGENSWHPDCNSAIHMSPVREPTCGICGHALFARDDLRLDDGSSYHRGCLTYQRDDEGATAAAHASAGTTDDGRDSACEAGSDEPRPG
jgi:hypothetical protein